MMLLRQIICFLFLIFLMSLVFIISVLHIFCGLTIFHKPNITAGDQSEVFFLVLRSTKCIGFLKLVFLLIYLSLFYFSLFA